MRILSLLLAVVATLVLMAATFAGTSGFATDFQTVAARPHIMPAAFDAGTALACDEHATVPCI